MNSKLFSRRALASAVASVLTATSFAHADFERYQGEWDRIWSGTSIYWNGGGYVGSANAAEPFLPVPEGYYASGHAFLGAGGIVHVGQDEMGSTEGTSGLGGHPDDGVLDPYGIRSHRLLVDQGSAITLNLNLAGIDVGDTGRARFGVSPLLRTAMDVGLSGVASATVANARRYDSTVSVANYIPQNSVIAGLGIGQLSGSNGTLTFRNSHVDIDGTLVVGNFGIGRLDVLDGSDINVSDPSHFGLATGSNATINVGRADGVSAIPAPPGFSRTGGGSGPFDFPVGYWGTSYYQFIDANSAPILQRSTLRFADTLHLGGDENGRGGTATVTVDKGGKVELKDTTVFTDSVLHSTNEGLIKFAESNVRLRGGELKVSEKGVTEIAGRLSIEDDGKVTINSGTLTLKPGQNRPLELSITRGSIKIQRESANKPEATLDVQATAPWEVSGRAKVELAGGRLKSAQQVNVAPIAANVADAQVSGFGRIETSKVYNKGVIEPGHDADKWIAHSSTLADGKLASQRHAQMIIVGDYQQSAEGTLRVWVTPESKAEYSGNSGYDSRPNQHVPIYITGNAQLAGTLEVKVDSEIGLPKIGDRYNVLEAHRIQSAAPGGRSRFDKIKGSKIDYEGNWNNDSLTDDPRFWSPLYTKAANDREKIELAVVRQPRPMSNISGSGNLVIVSHGIGDATAEFPTIPGGLDKTLRWQDVMARDAAAKAVGGNWDAYSVTWPEFSGYSAADKVNPGSGLFGLDAAYPAATYAGYNATSLGEGIGMWMAENGEANYSHVHSLGHSAGTWMANTIVDWFEANRNVTSQLTIFDAFGHNSQGTLEGYKGFRIVGKPTPALGATADYAEHYVDRTFLPFTKWDFQNLLNIDVSDLAPDVLPGTGTDPFDIENRHAWPRYWYMNTQAYINNPTELRKWAVGGWGYEISRERVGEALYNPTHADLLNRGERVILRTDNTWDLRVGEVNLQNPALHTLLNIESDTGIVTYAQDNSAITMATGSPVFVTIPIELTGPVDLVSFDYLFQGDGDGLFSLFLDGEQALGFFSDGSIGLQSTGWISLPSTYETGLHTLMIRLDPTTDDQSIVEFSNLRFALAEFQTVSVPEPTGALVFLGLASTLLGRSRRPKAKTKA